MSEKLDGVRCYWNGNTMYTRNGNPFWAPDWWMKKLPKIALDGELWTKRDDFSSIVSIVRKQDKDNTYNIIHMFDHFVFRSHTCITFELLSINLYELIKKNKFQGFSLQLVRKFAHSLLQCLDLLYRNKIIHCDMKPENVLLKQQGRSGIKVGIT